MPTTGGNISMKSSIPPADAFTVQRMRQAGALILAKGNLQEFARGGMSVSSLGGQVHNPYDLSRTPGGSSGGPAAAVAANFAVLATGSDTGQSIRSPASANNLVGIRPTRGLVSRSGMIPPHRDEIKRSCSRSPPLSDERTQLWGRVQGSNPDSRRLRVNAPVPLVSLW